jgi:hypothetical protein
MAKSASFVMQRYTALRWSRRERWRRRSISVMRRSGPSPGGSPARAGRAAENIAYGYESFEKTLGQWIDSSGHRKNLLLHNASRVGVASARDASGKRTYWAMVIAGDYEPKPKGKRDREPLVAVKREAKPLGPPKSNGCHIKVLSLCI